MEKKSFATNFEELNKQLNSISIAFKEKFENFDDVLDQDLEEDIDFENINILENEVYMRWTEKDVDSWILEKKINPCIADALRPSDGKMLYEIFLMKSRAPIFVHESFLTQTSTFTLRDYAIFSKEINTLFKKKGEMINF
jgi:hypothetical protein